MEDYPKRVFAFSAFRLDATERLLLRADVVVPLTPKAFDLLLALVEQPGRLLEKDTLLKLIWPDSFVEEKNLADNISRIRKALGEGENGEKFIETVPKHGYRFVAEVKLLPAEPVVAPRTNKITPSVLPSAAPLRWRQRPEFIFIAGGGLLVLLIISAAYYLRGGRGNAEAQQLEFMGNFYLSQWSEAEIRKGLEYFQRAATVNPRSASAYAGQATAWNFLTDLYVAPREAMPQAQAAATRALQLDEADVSAHVAMAIIKLEYDWDWAEAEREFQRALKLAPDYEPAHQLYAWYLIAVGRLAEAQAEMKHAADADARNGYNLWSLGLAYYFASDYDRAVEQFRRSLALDARSYWPHMLLGWTCAQEGKSDEAVAATRQALRLNDNPQVLASLGYAYARAGRRDEANQVLADLRQQAVHKYVSPYDVATVYAGLGETEQTLAWLEKAYEDRSGWLAWWLKVDPKFDGLREDARFRDLARRIFGTESNTLHSRLHAR
jgi:DNA-binding winged helix-turn-helix (wHTH) protein/tetratricopeptide (TPR) repeat protein